MGDADQRFDPHTVRTARLCNYWLGGKDNFALDRAVGDAVKAVYPGIVNDVRMTRRFHHRAVEWLTGVEGLRQFLDLGCGLPTSDETHEIAQAMAPDARVVYVDDDPHVMAHARALLTSRHQGSVGYVEADLRWPEAVLDGAGRTLDLAQPVAVLLIGVLHFLPDREKPQRAVRTLMEALPARSVLVVAHASMDLAPVVDRAAFYAFDRAEVSGFGSFTSRSKADIEEFFGQLAPMSYPGVVPVHYWHPRYGAYPVSEQDSPAAVYAGSALKT